MDTRKYGYTKVWIHESMDTRKYGYTKIWIGAFKKYVRPEGGGGLGGWPKANREGGGGAFTIAYVRFSKNCMANFVHAGYSYRII